MDNNPSVMAATDAGRGSEVRIGTAIPKVVDQHLELLTLKLGISKKKLFADALRFYLKHHGMEPDKSPKIEFSY